MTTSCSLFPFFPVFFVFVFVVVVVVFGAAGHGEDCCISAVGCSCR